MASRYSTNRKIKYTSISVAQLMGLAAILSIASCQKQCSPKQPEASMAMEIENSTLRDSDRTICAYIKNNGKVSTSLASFHLRASITETGGVGGSTLAYTDAGGNANKKEKIDEPLTHFTTEESLDHGESVTIALQVEPRTGVSQATITLELYDKNKEETVATETVEWSATSYKLRFIGIIDPAELKNNDVLQLQIKNEGDEVNTDDISLCLNSTEGVEFELNGHKGDDIKVSLNEILGTKTLAKGTSTNNIPLKLEDAKREYSSTITLELKQADKSLAQNTVEWSKEAAENKELELQIKQEKNTFTCSVTSETDQEFDFSKVNVSVSNIKKYAKGSKRKNNPEITTVRQDHGKTFEVVLDPKHKELATLEFQLQYDGKDIGEPQKVEWKKVIRDN